MMHSVELLSFQTKSPVHIAAEVLSTVLQLLSVVCGPMPFGQSKTRPDCTPVTLVKAYPEDFAKHAKKLISIQNTGAGISALKLFQALL